MATDDQIEDNNEAKESGNEIEIVDALAEGTEDSPVEITK